MPMKPAAPVSRNFIFRYSEATVGGAEGQETLDCSALVLSWNFVQALKPILAPRFRHLNPPVIFVNFVHVLLPSSIARAPKSGVRRTGTNLRLKRRDFRLQRFVLGHLPFQERACH